MLILFSDDYSIQEDGLTIKTMASSSSLISNSSHLSLLSDSLPLSPPAIDEVIEMKISKHDIVKGRKIGGGSSSNVFLGRIKVSGKLVALKVINKATQSSSAVQIFNEIEGLSNYSEEGCYTHPGMVAFYGAYLDDKSVVFCLEYMDAGSLVDVFKRIAFIPEVLLACITYQICYGLSFLHNVKHVLHRDIKPGNVLLNTKGEVKLADFGISRSAGIAPESKTFIGTFMYMSPERITGQSYSFPADVWAVGVIVLQAMLKKYPFPCTRFELIETICDKSSPSSLPRNENYSSNVHDLVALMLAIKPADRINAQEVLTHEWIKSMAFNHIYEAARLTRKLMTN